MDRSFRKTIEDREKHIIVLILELLDLNQGVDCLDMFINCVNIFVYFYK